MSGNRWLRISRPARPPRLRLICFPHAGSDAPVYSQWAAPLPPDIEICVIQLPGRGARLDEPLYTRLGPIVDDLAAAMPPLFDLPVALFGHSLGALLAFEVAQALAAVGHALPRCLVASGCRAPQLRTQEAPKHSLPEPAFVAELAQMSGTPTEILSNPEILAMVLPALRADFEIAETYVHRPRPPLSCPILSYGGLDDPDVSRSDLEGWRQQTASSFNLRRFPGGHFFLFDHQPLVAATLARDLSTY
jgi:medium-chain acyl-[acyl-carrier-protein] hydrolase